MGKIKIGNCGWSYLNAEKYFQDWKQRFESKLQAYAKLFSLVEVNLSFYNVPKIETAERWRSQADKISKSFEFTIKCNQLITHRDKFASKKSVEMFEKMKELAKVLRAKILLFQSPASFKPSKENLERVRKFFKTIKRENLVLVWEVRWANEWRKDIVENLFERLELEQCIDPFRQDLSYNKKIYYYRLHGLGSAMYNYSFSEQELEWLATKLKQLRKTAYVLFNNAACYENALEFAKICMKVS